MLNELRSRGLGQLLNQGDALGLVRDDLHLDQFMGIQGAGELRQDAVADTVLPDADYRLEVVGKAAKMTNLLIG